MADEYIRREDAIRLAEQGQVQGFPWQFQMLVRLPPADVIPVVRCKDCKFYTSMRPDIKTGICDLNVHHMGDDGFCSCGERKRGVR